MNLTLRLNQKRIWDEEERRVSFDTTT
jgi:hypothetical protein